MRRKQWHFPNAIDDTTFLALNFDDNNQEVIDKGFFHRNGTPQDISWVEGVTHTGISLNGSSSYIDFGDLDITGDSFTLMFWAKTTTKGDYKILGNSNAGSNGFMVGFTATPELRLEMDTDIPTSIDKAIACTTDDGNWHHYAVVYNGSTIQFYYDGLPLGTPTNCTGNVTAGTSNFQIGKAPWAGGLYYEGLLDRIFLYTKPFTSQEIYDEFSF